MRNYTVHDLRENIEKILIVESGVIIDQDHSGIVIAPTNLRNLTDTLDTMDIIFETIWNMVVVFYEDSINMKF